MDCADIFSIKKDLHKSLSPNSYSLHKTHKKPPFFKSKQCTNWGNQWKREQHLISARKIQEQIFNLLLASVCLASDL